ncbi:MAG: futalosine hydrolase [Candidatus Methanoperedenaceae archaeon]|nr:futalosine hydrolase [Candidatus Methanoperedenaceae archaeon]
MNITLIAPTPVESKEIRREIRPAPGDELKTIFQGDLDGSSVIFSHCGVGKVNAAHSATMILEKYEVDVLILFGIGGAYPDSGLKIGDIAVAESENYGEEGVLIKEGWNSMEFTGFPLLKKEKEYYNTFPLDANMSWLATDASKDCGFNVKSGNFVTVSQCSGTRKSGALMKERFNGLCENMEGAAAAHICAMYGVPMIEVRGISNIIEDRDLKKWNIDLAALNCNKVIMELVRRLK